jgi:hypothetical protein
MASLSFKQAIMTSTPYGYNHFYHITKAAENLNHKIENFTCNEDDIIEVEGYGKMTAKELYEVVNQRLYKNPAMMI